MLLSLVMCAIDNAEDVFVLNIADWTEILRDRRGAIRRTADAADIVMVPAPLFQSLLLVFLSLPVDAAQSVLKNNFEVFENVVSTPDPSDPSAWDFDWSFSGIR